MTIDEITTTLRAFARSKKKRVQGVPGVQQLRQDRVQDGGRGSGSDRDAEARGRVCLRHEAGAG